MDGQASCLHPSPRLLRKNGQLISYTPVYGEVPDSFATSRPPRLAFKFEAPLGLFTIFTNVNHHLTPVCSDTPSKLRQHENLRRLDLNFVADVSGDTSQQWQKN